MSTFPSMGRMNPYLGIGILAGVAFGLLFGSAFVLYWRDRQRRRLRREAERHTDGRRRRRHRPTLADKPIFYDVWHSVPGQQPVSYSEDGLLSWNGIQPLSGRFTAIPQQQQQQQQQPLPHDQQEQQSSSSSRTGGQLLPFVGNLVRWTWNGGRRVAQSFLLLLTLRETNNSTTTSTSSDVEMDGKKKKEGGGDLQDLAGDVQVGMLIRMPQKDALKEGELDIYDLGVLPTLGPWKFMDLSNQGGSGGITGTA